jgi:Spy/CpxP family protein refolding chaperone
MTKLRKNLLSCIGLYLILTMSLAHAEIVAPDDPGAKMHAGQRIQEIYSQLNLTDDQKKQLESNKQDHRAKMEITRQEMKVDKKALQEALMSPQLDMARIEQVDGQIKALLSQMEDDRLNSVLAVRSILTPDQFSKFVSLMRKHRQEHEGQ